MHLEHANRVGLSVRVGRVPLSCNCTGATETPVLPPFYAVGAPRRGRRTQNREWTFSLFLSLLTIGWCALSSGVKVKN